MVIIDDSVANNDTYFSIIGEEEDLNVRFGFAANEGSALVIFIDDEPCELAVIVSVYTVIPVLRLRYRVIYS